MRYNATLGDGGWYEFDADTDTAASEEMHKRFSDMSFRLYFVPENEVPIPQIVELHVPIESHNEIEGSISCFYGPKSQA